MESVRSAAAGRGRGRPRIQETADDIVASVLATAGPRVGTRDYSTRRIAELTGLSQSVVSRAVSRIRTGAVGGLDVRSGGGLAEVPDGGSAERIAWGSAHASASGVGEQEHGTALMGVTEFRVEFPRIVIVFGPSGPPPRGELQAFTRRAASVMAALWVSGAGEWPGAAVRPGAARVSCEGEDPVAPAEGMPAVSAGRRGSRASVVWQPGAMSWPEFLARVARALGSCAPCIDAIPGELLRQLAGRAGRGLHGVSWSRDDAGVPSAGTEENRQNSDSNMIAVPEFPAPGRNHPVSPRWLPQEELSVTEQIAIALRKEIMNAGFRPGDRLSPVALAAHMGLTAGTVRSGLRRLADDGLLATSDGAFRVPAVTGADVIDLYAARLHVGMVLLRGCAAQPRYRLLPARLALRAVEAAAAEGSGADVDQADLRFQEELADASGLAQSARSFHALTLRVRMFISVLQLDYSPAVDRIVSDDRRLFAALLGGRSEEAVLIWRGKLDNAVRHMSGLAPTSFDPELWSRLTEG